LVLKNLALRNFRNYRRAQVSFSPDRNLVIGRNAQGKTNLLESVFFVSHMRSNRTRNNHDLITRGGQTADLHAVIEGKNRINVAVAITESGVVAEVNSKRLASPGKAAGTLKCVLFCPDDLYLVKGEPSRRRDYLDDLLEELGPLEAELLRRYRHLLRQRNSLLKRWEEHGGDLERVMEPWDDALSQAGGKIVARRLEIVEGIAGAVERIYGQVSSDEKRPRLDYEGTFSGCEEPDVCAREMKRALEESSDHDRRARTTTVGPHRDDLRITLGGEEARYFASQGEQRTLALSLRLAEKGHIEEITGEAPVVLLDDVLSELDEPRRATVMSLAGDGSQSIITATEHPGGPDETGVAVFRVEGGEIAPRGA